MLTIYGSNYRLLSNYVVALRYLIYQKLSHFMPLSLFQECENKPFSTILSVDCNLLCDTKSSD